MPLNSKKQPPYSEPGNQNMHYLKIEGKNATEGNIASLVFIIVGLVEKRKATEQQKQGNQLELW